MAAQLLRLFPPPAHEVPLGGAYLADDLWARGRVGAPVIYADFVASLDGRIALDDPHTGESHVPPVLRSAGDFRLLQELEAQADCVITHGGYLRAVAAGLLDDILQVGLFGDSADLARWREQHGLPPQPAIAVVSASLDFVLPPSLARHGQRVLIATTSTAPPERISRLRDAGCEVVVAGDGRWVDAAAFTAALAERGYRSIFLLAGPRLLEGMLRAGRLDRLYLTLAHRLLGGEHFHSLVAGAELGEAGRLRLVALYDGQTTEGGGEWFAAFEPLNGPRWR